MIGMRLGGCLITGIQFKIFGTGYPHDVQVSYYAGRLPLMFATVFKTYENHYRHFHSKGVNFLILKFVRNMIN